jgi:hypothetical protein
MPSNVTARLTAVLSDELTGPLVGEYFKEGPDGVPWFTGAWFERIGGGGDTAPTANRITAEDLLAVQMLAVKIPAQAAIWMLGRGADRLAGYLAGIPVDLSPADPEGAKMLRKDDSALARLWHAIEGQWGVGWVMAGKLCARKRPALAPVFDQHVRDAAGIPVGWWSAVADLFADETVVRLLEEHRAVAQSSGGDVTLLRTLDIAIWMRQYGHRWASRDLAERAGEYAGGGES